MIELFANEKLITALAAALGAIVGNFITAYFNYIIKNKEIGYNKEKDKIEYVKNEIIPKFDRLIHFLEKCKIIVQNKNFSNLIKSDYLALNPENLIRQSSDIEILYERNWFRMFQAVHYNIMNSFEGYQMEKQCIELIFRLEQELLFYNSLQINKLNAGWIRRYIWRMKGKSKFKHQNN